MEVHREMKGVGYGVFVMEIKERLMTDVCHGGAQRGERCWLWCVCHGSAQR